MNGELLDEARATIERWAGDLDDAGPEFQTLHMLASYLLAIADRALPKIDADERSKILRAARRIGPTEPDDTMVICPVCTSQFRAIPLDVQRQLDFLSAPERGERGTSRLGSSARELPAAETAESADERESTADSPDRRDAAARVAAPEGRNRKPSDASLGKDAPGRFAMLRRERDQYKLAAELNAETIRNMQRERS